MSDADASTFTLAANVSMLYTELPLHDRFAAAAAAGFQATEAWWPYPATAVPPATELEAFIDAATGTRAPLRGLNFFAGDMPAGERGILNDPARVEEFAANVDVMVDIAGRTGLQGANALYGQCLQDGDAASQDAAAIDNLALATRRLADVGATVLVEALASGLNGAYPLKKASQVAFVVTQVRERTGLQNISLLFDTFHLASNGEELLHVVDEYADLIGHVQLADAPGRAEPGTGEIDFPAVLDRLWERGYRGIVACEYKPTTTTPESLGWLDDMTRIGLEPNRVRTV